MTRYIIRRVLGMIPLLLGISFIVFALLNLVPGSPTNQFEFNPSIKPEDIARIKENLGLNAPWYERYFIWLGNALRGDFGISFTNYRPVTDIIAAALPNTLLLAVVSLVISLVISIPLGVYSAVRRNSLFDRVTTILSTGFFSVPTVWLGLLMIILFAVKFQEWGLPSLPTSGVRNLREPDTFMNRLQHLILPAVTLSLVSIAGWSRYIRTQMLEAIHQDFVRTAQAKGLKTRVVLMSHALRNAVLPLVTLIGLTIPDLFGGALITENVFAYPGIGQQIIKSLNSNDYSVAMACVMMLATLTVVGNLIADILYGVLDPRVRYD